MQSERSPADIVAAVDALAERKMTCAGGVDIAWRIWGSGPPVLLLHGNFGSWTHWIRNIPLFAERAQVIAPDMPGFGDSGMPSEPPSVDGLAKVLQQGLSQLALFDTPIAVVGFSFGSTIAGALARALGSKARQLVVVSAGQVGARRQPIAPFVSWRRLATEEERVAAHRKNLQTMMISDPMAIDDLAVHLQSRNASRRRLATEALTASHPLRSILFELRCQVDGIWGARDATIGPFMQDRIDLMSQLGPTSRAIVIEKAGHWVQYEAAEAFNAALWDCLGFDASHSRLDR